MPRLIDADALVDRLKFKWKVSEFGLHRGLESAIAQCNKAPTVDAVSRGVHEQVRWERDVAIEQLESYGVSLGEKAEVAKVVHGRWIDNIDENGYLCNAWRKCSACGGLNWSKRPNYCPNCGAKMDGDGNG